MAIECGRKIQTPYGEALVRELRDKEGDIVCIPTNWRLAKNCEPVFYLNRKDVKLVPLSVPEMLEKSRRLKGEGTELFKTKQYKEACVKYNLAASALGTNEGTSLGDFTDEERASVFELSVPLHNNIARCYMQMGSANESYVFALNGYRLVDALERKTSSGDGSSKVMDALIKLGTIKSVDHMKKDWKRVSMLIMGRAKLALKEFDLASKVFKEGLALIESDEAYKDKADELKKLINICARDKKTYKDKEKAAYSKGFSPKTKNKAPLGDKNPETSISPSASPQISPTVSVDKRKISVDTSVVEVVREEAVDGQEEEVDEKYIEEYDSQHAVGDVKLDTSDWLILGSLGLGGILGIAYMLLKKR